MLKVLFLARWYPNRYDPMFGLFIQRHAESLKGLCELGVLYVHAANDLPAGSTYELELLKGDGIRTVKVYYKAVTSKNILTRQLLKAFRFYKANILGIRHLKADMGGFDLIHIHILSRLGLIGLYYKWMRQIPFVVSEHWSRYQSITGGFNGIFRKWLTRLVVRNAYAVTTVTENLSNAMKHHGLNNDNYQVLANVVDPVFFNANAPKQPSRKKKLVHISCFEDKSKNISGLLRVIQQLKVQRDDFIFQLIGSGMDFEWLKQLSVDLGLDGDTVQFSGLLEGTALADAMGTADLTVVFSNFENFPVVINESFVLGVPVIASRVGGIPEFVHSQNGILVDAQDEEGLLCQLNNFLDGKIRFKANDISEKARVDYAPAAIGNHLLAIYQQATSRH